MSSPVKIAVIGAGLIGPRHAQTISDNSSAILTAIVDPTSSGSDLAQRHYVPHFTDLSSLLTSEHKPDAAVICTPNHTHVPIGLELVRAGVHILVEKPVATNVESGAELIREAKRASVKMLVGHHRRFNSVVIGAKQVLDRGDLGTVIAVNGLWVTFKPDEYFGAQARWRAQWENGGGVILINMIHEIDVLQHLLGPIVRVYCEATPPQRHRPDDGREHTAEEGAAITLRFHSGVVGTFLLCDTAPSSHSFESATGENPLIPKTGTDIYRIFGTDGTLSVPELSLSNYHGRPQKSWHEDLNIIDAHVAKNDGRTPFKRQLEHFVHVIKGVEEPRCTGEEGLAALVVCEALRTSMKTGQAVDVDVVEVR